jgi:shikimate dehydrogenase
MKRACVIGWPVAHSRSPDIHNYWLRLYGIDGVYEKEGVPPEEIGAFLRSLGERGYVGANVTLPHKEAALAAAEFCDETANRIGAANTLWLDEVGRLHATNTDAYGFMTHLEEAAPRWNARKRAAMILGAGGAARAIVYGLVEAGCATIRLANRTPERTEAIAADFSAVEVVRWEDRGPALADCGLLVNTTSLGMAGKPPLEIDLSVLPRDAVVADIVYNPLETALLAAARLRGNVVVDGLGMLLHQAVPGFALWFGVSPKVTPELRAKIAATLGAP